jgi:hypothetical protein
MVMRLCFLSAGICCLLAIVFIRLGVPRQIAVLLLLPALLGVLGAIWFAIDLLVNRPIDKILLGDRLQLWPSRAQYTVHEVSQIEFVAGPEQDYAEIATLANTRATLLTVQARSGFRSIGLRIDAPDAAILSAWARENGVPLVGADHAR